jgi:VWFA-related protein
MNPLLLLITIAAATLATAGIHLLAAQVQQPPPRAQTGAFRTGITIVPLDIRVVDRNGTPVTDLTRDDFTIAEDGVQQTIAHFSVHGMTAAVPNAKIEALPLRTAPSSDLKAQNRRVILIVLGRGRMDGPTREIPGLMEFFTKGLLPQDRVAILAFNRATDFTTDRAGLLNVVERYRARHSKIETDLEQRFSGLAAVYGSPEIPPSIQAQIDAVFEGVTALRPREIRPGQITDKTQLARDQRTIADELIRAEQITERRGEFAGLDPATAAAERLELSFDEYVSQQNELNQDLGNLYAGIDYLRHIDGEKRLVFLTPKGLPLPRAENDRSLGATAADARVAIDVIFTGGTVGAPPPRFSNGRLQMSALPTTGAVFSRTFNVQALRTVAELTGGHVTTLDSVGKALGKIDSTTRFQYLLGYAPSNTTLDGRFRRLTVGVKRPGLTVQYRRGYFATTQVIPLDRREFTTHTRLVRAGAYDGIIKDIDVTIASATYAPDTGWIDVQLTLQSSRVLFTENDGRHRASLDVAIYCGDARERVVCQSTHRVDLALTPAALDVFKTKGATITAKVRSTVAPKYVKAIVYDYAADVLGTAILTLRATR